MFDNHLYNLMAQMNEEHKSLWRIQNMYLRDAGDCQDCQKFWNKMIKDKKDHIEELKGLMKTHM